MRLNFLSRWRNLQNSRQVSRAPGKLEIKLIFCVFCITLNVLSTLSQIYQSNCWNLITSCYSSRSKPSYVLTVWKLAENSENFSWVKSNRTKFSHKTRRELLIFESFQRAEEQQLFELLMDSTLFVVACTCLITMNRKISK